MNEARLRRGEQATQCVLGLLGVVMCRHALPRHQGHEWLQQLGGLGRLRDTWLASVLRSTTHQAVAGLCAAEHHPPGRGWPVAV
eukprot:351865-Chlamydomonas_euryale.AAC.1